VRLVVDGVLGQCHERFLEGGLPGHELVQGDVVPDGQVADGGGAEAAHRQALAVRPGPGGSAVLGQQPG
jgi:hypothetical protein